MALSKQNPSQIVYLAKRLEDDIRARGLQPGDPYLNTQETARMLSVSNAAANRALQLLEKRNILRRRQRSGTFIADPAQHAADLEMNLVHILVHQDYLKTEGLLTDGVVLGIQEKLPSAEIQVNFLPANDDGAYANRLIAETLSSKQIEGYVLVRAPLAVQRIVQASGLPAVIHGAPFPSVTNIAWIDRDNYQAGRLATKKLAGDGFDRLTVITRDRITPGDNPMFNGVRDEMSAAGLPIERLNWRSLPSDAEVVRHETMEILRSGGTSRKSRQRTHRHGFICRSRPAADGVAQAIETCGCKLGVDAQIVLLDVYQSSLLHAPPYPHLMLAMNPETIGQHIGDFLLAQARGVKLEPPCEMIPMVLVDGNSKASKE